MSGEKRKLRLMIPTEQAKREASQKKHARDVARGACCRAHHYGCKETRRHAHWNGEVVIREGPVTT